MLPVSDPNPTAIYRLFGADGVLLYVGISNDPPVRYKQHAGDKPWWHEVATKVEEWQPDRATAKRLETKAITTESPRYNLLESPNYPPKPPGDGMSVAEFRAQFSETLAQTRYAGKIAFLYSRGKRVAAVVPVELAEAAEAVGGPVAAVEIARAASNS